MLPKSSRGYSLANRAAEIPSITTAFSPPSTPPAATQVGLSHPHYVCPQREQKASETVPNTCHHAVWFLINLLASARPLGLHTRHHLTPIQSASDLLMIPTTRPLIQVEDSKDGWRTGEEPDEIEGGLVGSMEARECYSR